MHQLSVINEKQSSFNVSVHFPLSTHFLLIKYAFLSIDNENQVLTCLCMILLSQTTFKSDNKIMKSIHVT